MDKNFIRAYLWQDIIRLGFCPHGTKNQMHWLHQFGQSLKNFWEVDTYPKSPCNKNGKTVAVIDCTVFDVYLEYTVEHAARFMVSFFFALAITRELMWKHDVDGSFCTFPVQPFLTYHNQRNAAVKEFSCKDIEAVLDGLIFHPAAHQHIMSPIDSHEIRIGGGINNPFLYLFHLRYQLCPHREKREAERNRLIELFTNAVKSNSPITVNELMAQPQI